RHFDALVAHDFQHGLPEHRVEVLQRPVSSQYQGGARSQCGKDAGQLDGDVTTAHDGDPIGPGLQIEETIRGDAQLGTRNVRQHGASADGDEDMRCGECSTRRLHGPVRYEAGATAHELDVSPAQVALLRGIESGHVTV